MDYSPPGSSVRGIFQAKNTGMGCHFHLQGNLPNPETEPRSPTLQADLPAEPQGNIVEYYSAMKKKEILTHYKMDELGGHYAK